MLLSELNTTPMVGSVLATANLVGALRRDGTPDLPPIHAAGYEYVVAANGLFIRAEDSRMEAMVPAAPVETHLPGLVPVEPYARLKLPRVPAQYLHAMLYSARRKLPAEAMYQISWDGAAWRCRMPAQTGTRASLEFADDPTAVIDLHSHGTLNAFFSDTDDGDEKGLRFYVVIGKLHSDRPVAIARAGVYGHFLTIPMATVFNCTETHAGPFADLDYLARVPHLMTHVIANHVALRNAMHSMHSMRINNEEPTNDDLITSES